MKTYSQSFEMLWGKKLLTHFLSRRGLALFEQDNRMAKLFQGKEMGRA